MLSTLIPPQELSSSLKPDVYFRCGGRLIGPEDELSQLGGGIIQCCWRLRGGKGGFGSGQLVSWEEHWLLAEFWFDHGVVFLFDRVAGFQFKWVIGFWFQCVGGSLYVQRIQDVLCRTNFRRLFSPIKQGVLQPGKPGEDWIIREL